MPMTVYTDKDCDPAALHGKKIAILGYGNQGHAHALNLRDSGFDVIIGARDPGQSSGAKARDAGFMVLPFAEAVTIADIVMMTLPDEVIPAISESAVAPFLAC
jgi:ketol-acid reductoisomerase